MEQAEFYHMAFQIIETIDFPFIMEAHIDERGVIPVGFAKLKTVETHVEPHFYWFWWSTPRARYEAGFKLFHKLAEDVPFLFGVEKGSEAQTMAEHIVRAGTMRRVGTSFNWSQGVTMALYETRD